MIEEKHANIEQIADVVCDDLSTRVYIGITFLLLVSALGISRHKPIFLMYEWHYKPFHSC